MAFESLADKLQNVFKNLTGKGRLSESDVKAGLKEVKMALLEADVSFKVVKQFISSVQERAIGTDVLNGLNPGQMVIKIVNDELVKLMGSEMTEIALKPGNEITVIMMAGLQGAGKTRRQRLPESSRQREETHCWQHVMSTDRRQSNSCRKMVKNRVFPYLRWERTTNRSISQRRRLSTQRKMATMWLSSIQPVVSTSMKR